MQGHIRLHTGNRLEVLADRLADVVARPLADPLDQEVIVVQSRGMERWLTMQLAERLGSWANCRYPFPNALAWEMFRQTIDALPDENPYAPEVIAWRLMEIFPNCIGMPCFEPLRSYLAGTSSELKLYQLAGQIADLFDQYTIFRPKMLAAWESGRSCDRCRWQAELWRMLASLQPAHHRGTLLLEFQRTMGSKKPLTGKIPERISVFGIPTLPPFHIEILSALACRTEVNLFLLNPCREHWFLISSKKEKARSAIRSHQQPGLFDPLDEDNPLLASMGAQGRDFHGFLYDGFQLDEGGGGVFIKPEGNDILQRIQSEILELTDGTSPGGQHSIAEDDRSLQLHSCHSPLREVETLHDRLLELFETTPGLAPRDILVMIPRIDEYAPYITAVFGGAGDEGQRIPYAIADRSVTCTASLVRGFLSLLDLAESRCGASQVLDLLEHPAVSRRFGMERAGLMAARRWVTESGIRWGVDVGDRTGEGLPPFSENSWRVGLDRLLLGYALQGDGRTLYSGILPYADMEGSDARLLGGLLEFTNLLFTFRGERGAVRSPIDWADYLTGLLGSFFIADDELQPELALLTTSFAELRKGSDYGFTGRIGLAVVRSWLLRRLDRDPPGYGFLAGRVTFCAMLPMRSIPFRVIAMLGMDDGIFPRRDSPSGFDLMAAFPRRCDRSMRNEDRYLFLEALLSARDALYISYVGQSSRDNASLPPSVLVSELLDYAERSFTLPGSVDDDRRSLVRNRLVIKHHLQPFHADYFSSGNPRLFSYSEENCRAAESRHEGGGGSRLLAGLPLALPSIDHWIVTLDQLSFFLRSPAGHFLRNRLGIRLERITAPVEDNEPFGVDPLADYLLCGELVDQILSGGDAGMLANPFRARGVLPPGGQGRVAFEALRERAEHFAATVRPLVTEKELAPLPLDILLGDCRLTGRISGIHPGGLVRYRCARRKAKDLLACWVEHLALNMSAPAGYPCGSILVAIDGIWRFSPLQKPADLLAELLDYYRQGLCEPLPFFPECSLAFSEEPGRADKVIAAWNGSEWEGRKRPGEREKDQAFDLCFVSMTAEALFASERFRNISSAVYSPVLASLKGEEP